MLRVVFLTLALVASSVLAKQYTFIDTAQSQLLPDQCDGKCAQNLKVQAENVKEIAKIMKKIVVKDLGICSECHITGFHDFAIPEVSCMENKENGLIDNSFKAIFANLGFKCNCNLNTLPSKLADQINKFVEGENSCGLEDITPYSDVQCSDDGTTADAVIPVAIQGNLNAASFDVTLRANTATKVDYPIMANAEFTAQYTATEDNAEDAGKFAKSFECMKQNDQQFIQRLFKRVISVFFPCLSNQPGGSLFDKIFYEAASCQV